MKTVLVTGATAGIGEACVRAFAKAGWRVVGTGRRAERLKALQDELGADRFHPCVFDVRDEDVRDKALDADTATKRKTAFRATATGDGEALQPAARQHKPCECEHGRIYRQGPS